MLVVRVVCADALCCPNNLFKCTVTRVHMTIQCVLFVAHFLKKAMFEHKFQISTL